MRKSIIALVKKCFLFYILFDFFTLAFGRAVSAFVDVLPNIRIFDFSFYDLQFVYIQVILLLMDLLILAIVAIRYFRLLLSFVDADEKENDYTEEETVPEIIYKRKKIRNSQIMFIVMYLIISIFISFIIQFLGMFSRY